MTQVDARRYRYRNNPRELTMKTWSPEEDAKLLALYADSFTVEEIARELRRTENGVNYRIRLLKPERTEKTGTPCGKCGKPCVRECGLTWCQSCAWEPEESKGVVIIG